MGLARSVQKTEVHVVPVIYMLHVDLFYEPVFGLSRQFKIFTTPSSGWRPSTPSRQA
jgi:hypothetical protein